MISPGGGCALPGLQPKSPRVLGLLKLPGLAASTSLRRSRKAGAARMDAG
ncbi:LysR family transcriptional regulator [Klebsiella pneumoniae]|nr:LysR family transcriptional regulator [Klebsiella pneumoniae]